MKPIEQIIERSKKGMKLAVAQAAPLKIIKFWNDADFEWIDEQFEKLLTQSLKDYGDYLIAQMGEEIEGPNYILDGSSRGAWRKGYNQALADARSNMKKANE